MAVHQLARLKLLPVRRERQMDLCLAVHLVCMQSHFEGLKEDSAPDWQCFSNFFDDFGSFKPAEESVRQAMHHAATLLCHLLYLRRSCHLFEGAIGCNKDDAHDSHSTVANL